MTLGIITLNKVTLVVTLKNATLSRTTLNASDVMLIVA
jgi:hypothetical protein